MVLHSTFGMWKSGSIPTFSAILIKIGEVELKEIWKPLIYPLLDNKYNHYEISSFGNLRNINTNKILKPSLLRTGYYSVRICLGNRKEKMHIIIHKAVAYTFLKNSNNYTEVNHKDNIRTNNNVNNLEWCNSHYNQQYKYDSGSFDKRKISGENNHSHKLTWEDVNFIRRNYSYNNKIYSLNKLAQKFNVSKNTILKIIKEKTWKNDYGAIVELVNTQPLQG